MEELFITICVIGFTLTVLSPYFFNRYTKFKLEIEKMRLESELRKEEIRAKNQFDIEKYMADEQLKAGRMQAKTTNAADAGAPANAGGVMFAGASTQAAPQYQRNTDAQPSPAAFRTQSDFTMKTDFGTQSDFGTQPDFATKTDFSTQSAFGTQSDFGTQPDFDDIGMRSNVYGSGAQVTNPANDSHGREKLRY